MARRRAARQTEREERIKAPKHVLLDRALQRAPEREAATKRAGRQPEIPH